MVCCPGGFGTLDEALEVLTLLQTGKREMVPVVFLDVPGKNYWKVFHDFIVDHLLTDGMISENDLSLFKLTDNAQEAVDEILQFFRVYHSMRFVKQQLVLRLQSAPSEQLLADINQNFSDILVDGEFISCAALPEEKDQPDLADMMHIAAHVAHQSTDIPAQPVIEADAAPVVGRWELFKASAMQSAAPTSLLRPPQG